MAIGTPVSLGSTADAAASDPYTVSTGTTVPSGALVVLCGWTGQATTAPTFTVNGGGLTWTEDSFATGTGLGAGWRAAIWSAPAPSGLASSTTLNMDIGTGSGTTFSGLISCFYITGVSLLSDRVNAQLGTFTGSSGVQNWTAGPATTTIADTILVGIFGGDWGSLQTNTATNGATEIHDLHSSDDITLASEYKIVSATGSQSVTGSMTAATSGDSATVLVAYAIDAGGVGPQARTFNAIPFMR